jgi:hypothetical protein
MSGPELHLAPVDDSDDTAPASDSAEDDRGRRPWHEGPDDEALPESWLGLADDELLHRVESVEPEDNADDRLIEIVESERHFFLRQEAAKKIGDRKLLFAYENDRHVGQILVRHLTRREDVTYLERLVAKSHHVEVRAAAQVQLAQLWGRLGGPTPADGEDAPPAPQFLPPPSAEEEVEVIDVEADPDGVDGSLLGWAIHFLVESTWAHLGTGMATDLLARSHAGILAQRPALSYFTVERDARVNIDLSLGAKLPKEAVGAVASWMTTFLDAAARVAPDMETAPIREATRLMVDALEQVGFYEACENPERVRPPVG